MTRGKWYVIESQLFGGEAIARISVMSQIAAIAYPRNRKENARLWNTRLQDPISLTRPWKTLNRAATIINATELNSQNTEIAFGVNE